MGAIESLFTIIRLHVGRGSFPLSHQDWVRGDSFDCFAFWPESCPPDQLCRRYGHSTVFSPKRSSEIDMSSKLKSDFYVLLHDFRVCYLFGLHGCWKLTTTTKQTNKQKQNKLKQLICMFSSTSFGWLGLTSTVTTCGLLGK